MSAGYAGVTTEANSVAMLSLTESPTKRICPTAGAEGSTAGPPVVSYHGELRSQSLRKSHPLRVTTPAVPVIVTEVAYPFHSPPRPSCVVTTEVSTPIVGYFFWTSVAGRMRAHDCSWASAMMSPSSIFALKVPPAVRPPFEDVNSVRAIAPAALRMTTLAVSVIARSLRGSSRTAAVEPPTVREAAPPYTWQSCVSHVLAYE